MKTMMERWRGIGARVRAYPTRSTAVSSFLRLESAVTFLPWLVSWLLCAIGLSVVAGYQTAKGNSEAKRKMLTAVLGGKE